MMVIRLDHPDPAFVHLEAPKITKTKTNPKEQAKGRPNIT